MVIFYLKCIHLFIFCYFVLNLPKCVYTKCKEFKTVLYHGHSYKSLTQKSLDKLQHFNVYLTIRAQQTEICSKNIFYENIISDVLWMFTHSILSFIKHYGNVTFECSLNILKQVVTF